ncbi:MAG: hypothetical protein ACTHMF_06465 [Leifsonia sp.]|uniref:hypothetical protein n=1 Tax=Leifsonia sp. TaxID=1870902 RepID=UPI003F7EA8D6
MSFFPADPPDDEPEGADHVPAPWWKPSDEELPAPFPIGETIALTERVALILTIARVYSNGVELVVERRVRRGDSSRRDWQELQSRMHDHFGRFDPERLRYGVVLGDGQKLILDLAPGLHGVAPERHALTHTRGNGGGSEDFSTFEDGMWLWPLPPEGPLEVVAQWPAFGVPESHVVLDSAPLRELASRARPVWGE